LASSRNGRGGFGLPAVLRSPKRWIAGVLPAAVIALSSVRAVAADGSTSARSIIDQLLAFLYSSGHLVGQGIMRLVHTILPSVPTARLDPLIDPVGLLAILTAFLVVVTVARKLAWIVVIAGWVLIVIRLVMVIVEHSV